MATLNMDFNASEVPEDERNFDALPAGDYHCQVINSEIKPTKANNGDELLELTIEVISGPHERRLIWDRLNIKNSNADAQRIAQRALADLCLAVGIASLRDTADLHFKPFLGKVRIVKDKSGQYADQNGIRYRPLGNTPPANKPAPVKAANGNATSSGGAAQPQQQAPQRAAAGGASRPWKR
jgi:hypothetical protein